MAMPPERIAHAISFLTGEVHSLLLFSQILAATHSDPQAVLAALDGVEQQGLGRMEMLPIPDAAIEGFRFGIDEVRKAAIVAAGNQPT